MVKEDKHILEVVSLYPAVQLIKRNKLNVVNVPNILPHFYETINLATVNGSDSVTPGLDCLIETSWYLHISFVLCEIPIIQIVPIPTYILWSLYSKKHEVGYLCLPCSVRAALCHSGFGLGYCLAASKQRQEQQWNNDCWAEVSPWSWTPSRSPPRPPSPRVKMIWFTLN